MELINPVAKRWYPLRQHPTQSELFYNSRRFAVVPSGRRSGKTETAKRKVALDALKPTSWDTNYFFLGAPTRPQAKRIYWNDIKELTKPFWAKKPMETDLVVFTFFGGVRSEIHVLGMDTPSRIEGAPWNGGILDEYANMKKSAWDENVSPALADRLGWCWFIGVPEGRNHYYRLADYATGGNIPDALPAGGVVVQSPDPEWAYYQWNSADILPASEIASARRRLDTRTFSQEFEGTFLSYEGQLYYTFDRVVVINDQLAARQLDTPLILTCDFNKSPMVWEVAQTFIWNNEKCIRFCGEVSIDYNAKTQNAARQFVKMYGNQRRKDVLLTGDSSSNYESVRDWTTDYIIIRDILRQAGWNVKMDIPSSNPSVNNRINIACSLMTPSPRTNRLFMHSSCQLLRRDFELVESDGKGAKLKDDAALTHASDAADYAIFQQFATEFYHIQTRQY